jgi:hypothetical protein
MADHAGIMALMKQCEHMLDSLYRCAPNATLKRNRDELLPLLLACDSKHSISARMGIFRRVKFLFMGCLRSQNVFVATHFPAGIVEIIADYRDMKDNVSLSLFLSIRVCVFLKQLYKRLVDNTVVGQNRFLFAVDRARCTAIPRTCSSFFLGVHHKQRCNGTGMYCCRCCSPAMRHHV